MSVFKEILDDIKAAITTPEKKLPVIPEGEPAPVPATEEPTHPTTKEPAPTVVQEPAFTGEREPVPTVEQEPAPTLAEEPAPTLAEEPAPTLAEEPAPTLAEEPAPTLAEEPGPAIAEIASPPPEASAAAGSLSGHGAVARPEAAWRPSPTIIAIAALAAVALIAVVAALLLTRDGPVAGSAPEGTIAAYSHPARENRVYVTQADLDAYLAGLPAGDRASLLATADGYRAAVEKLVADQLLWDWLLGRLGSESLHHVVFDATRDRFPVNNFDDVLATIPISESEVRQYFEDYPEQFPGSTLSEVRDEIVALLRKDRQAPYLQDYVARLKSEASFVQYPEVLAVPQPDEDEAWAYYQEHLVDFVPPSKATVDWLRFRRSAAARDEAESARIDLEGGQDWQSVAQSYAQWATAAQDFVVVEGQKAAEFDEAIFNLQAGELSSVFDGSDAYYIVRVLEIVKEPARPFEEVKEEIHRSLWLEAAEEWFKTRKDSSVFVVEGQPYSAGDFYAAFKALPDDVRASYHSSAGLTRLADLTLEWLLILEDARHEGWPPEGAADPGTRVALLIEATGTETIYDLEISDEEVLDYYNEHPEIFIMPTRFKIRYIAVDLGSGAAEEARAWAKAQEAYERLTQNGRPPTEVEFRQVARLYAQDPEGGEPEGWIVATRPEEIQVISLNEDLLAHPLYNSLLDLQADQVTEPFELDGTLYVVHVWDREEKNEVTLWDATNYLGITWGKERAQAAAEELTRLLLEQADFVVYEENLPRGR